MKAIKLRPLHQRPIAHTHVFEQRFERSPLNSLRYVLKAYLNHKDMYLRDILYSLNIHETHTQLQFSLRANTTLTVPEKTLDKICDKVGISKKKLLIIAQEFSLRPEYNAITFDLDGNPVFFKAFKRFFGY